MITARGELLVVEDAAAVARAGAERFVAVAARACASHGRCSVALAGGSTPKAMHALLTAPPLVEQVDWPRLDVLFGDERCVPPDHADSNYRMARLSLLDHVAIDPARVHRMEGEREPADAAARYQRTLGELLGAGDPPRIDLVFLGMGDDGHTASLFPGTPVLAERTAWVAPVHVARLDAWRVTLTAPILSAAGEVVVMLAGAGKAEALARALQGEEGAVPIQLVKPPAERMIWIVDRAAASRLQL
jgi:6-phosphogluconolactonase